MTNLNKPVVYDPTLPKATVKRVYIENEDVERASHNLQRWVIEVAEKSQRQHIGDINSFYFAMQRKY